MPRASSLEAQIQEQHPDAEIELARGRGGVFDVTVGDALVFSKHQTGRYPEAAEILASIAALQ